MCDIQSTTHGSNKPPMDILEVVSFTQYRRDKNVVTIDLQSLLCALLPTSDVSRTLTYSNHHFLSLFETRSFDTSFVRTIIALIEGGERQKRRMNEAKSKVGRMKNLHVEFEELTIHVATNWREKNGGKACEDFPPYLHLHVSKLSTSLLTHHLDPRTSK